MYNCEIEVEKHYIVVKTLRPWKHFRVEIGSIESIVFDEISGKTIIKLEDGKMIEVQPQTVSDRDSVSSLLVLLAVALNPTIFDNASKVLKAFCKAATVVIKLALTLYRGSYINWRKLSEISEELASIDRLGRELWTGTTREEIDRVFESISQRDTVGLVKSLRNSVTSLYESTKSDLARILPGSSSESLLDVVLASALNSAIRSLDVSLPEKEVVNSLTTSALKRFFKIFNMDEASRKSLEALLQSTHCSEELVDRVIEELKRNLGPASIALRKHHQEANQAK